MPEARPRPAAFETTWASTYPGAVACLASDLDTLTVSLRFPRQHWRRIRWDATAQDCIPFRASTPLG